MSRRPRIRTLKPEFWQDERFSDVSRDALLLYVGLHTQADDEGRQTANLALLKARILPLDPEAAAERITSWLNELEASELVVVYDVLPGCRGPARGGSKRRARAASPRNMISPIAAATAM